MAGNISPGMIDTNQHTGDGLEGRDSPSDSGLFDDALDPTLNSVGPIVTDTISIADQYSPPPNRYPTLHTNASNTSSLPETSPPTTPPPDITAADITANLELKSLYVAYAAGFSDPTATNEAHLARAKPLVTALLEHYYPCEQNFHVLPTSFDMMAKHGWSFWLAPDDWDPHKSTTTLTKGTASKKKKKPVKPSGPVWRYMQDRYHNIAPEHITGFMVVRKLEIQDDNGSTHIKQTPHTYLGIMMDNLSTFSQWVPESFQRARNTVTNARIELLSYSLGMKAGIVNGYGILLLGPRFEFYNYRQLKWEPKPNQKEEEAEEGEYVPWERMDEWAVDVREGGFVLLDALFREVCGREVMYGDGTIGVGAKGKA